jgi:hypothetical protein
MLYALMPRVQFYGFVLWECCGELCTREVTQHSTKSRWLDQRQGHPQFLEFSAGKFFYYCCLGRIFGLEYPCGVRNREIFPEKYEENYRKTILTISGKYFQGKIFFLLGHWVFTFSVLFYIKGDATVQLKTPVPVH